MSGGILLIAAAWTLGQTGPGPNTGYGEIAWRAVAIYLAGLIIVRMGKSRLLGRTTAFDIILGIILGSLFSRAINGSAEVLNTVLAGAILVTMHWLIGMASYRWPTLDVWLKGRHRHLILDGQLQTQQMQKSEVSDKDLGEALRLKGKTDSFETVQKACLERNGEISVIPHHKTPKVLEVSVQDGVQTVRIQLE